MTENDYVLRRVLWYMMIVTKGLQVLDAKEYGYPLREAAKAGVLISLRALSMFLTDDPVLKDDSRKYPNDAFIIDLGFSHGTGLPNSVRQRINKVIAHPVNKKSPVFKHSEEIRQFAKPVLEECAKFVCDCLANKKAKLTGRAPNYLQHIRKVAPHLALPEYAGKESDMTNPSLPEQKKDPKKMHNRLLWGGAVVAALGVAALAIILFIVNPDFATNLVALLGVVVWPATVLAIIFLFRRSIVEFANQAIERFLGEGKTTIKFGGMFTISHEQDERYDRERLKDILEKNREAPSEEIAEQFWRERASPPELRLLLALTNNIRDGMPLDLYTEHATVGEIFRQSLQRLQKKGLVERYGKCYVITEKGVEVVWHRIGWVRNNYSSLRQTQ